jgi:hypothetical protein|tara:strand:- start:53 stop:280 length:228 start_codon:yes stop_codon:yes gene_type:complete
MSIVNVELKKETIRRAFNHTVVHRRVFENLERGHPYYDLMLEIRRSINAIDYRNKKKNRILKLLNKINIFSSSSS